jgi:two-component system LytT family response regulator
MAIRALIVDDEADARDNLRLMLQEHCPQVETAGMVATAEAARKFIEQEDPDVLFLDIKMPGEDGFSLLRSLSPPHIPVIFTTAYDEYALQAFKENALDYLEKPIDPEELLRAVGKLTRALGDPVEIQRRSEGVQTLINDPASPLSNRVAVPSRDGLVLLRHEDILYLEASDSYTVVHTKDGKRSISSKHIRVFEQNLDPRKFFRAHKSYIINLEHLKSFSRSEGNMAVLDNGALVPVSRRRLPELLAMINTF